MFNWSLHLMDESDYSRVVLEGRSRIFSLQFAGRHGHFEVKHVGHPVVLVYAGHHVRQLGELVTATDQYQMSIAVSHGVPPKTRFQTVEAAH
jgi:hypothetical protein